MKDFMYSYPTRVYFGDGAAEKAFSSELAKTGKKVMLAYGGGSVKRNGIYDEIYGYLKRLARKLLIFLESCQIQLIKKCRRGLPLQGKRA